MLSFEPQWIDVLPFLLRKEQPVALIRREPVHANPKAWAGKSQVGKLGEFWVPVTSPLEEEVVFAPTKIGDAVRVPMFAYKTPRRLLSDIFGLGVQIGMATITEMRKHTQDVPRHVTMVLAECTDLSPTEECYRCYIGIAIQTK